MGARTKARKRALDVLYAADLRRIDPLVVLGELEVERQQARGAMNAYTAELVHGVVGHLPRIDELLATHSQGWETDRMPAIDRNLLRIGIFELLWSSAVPDAVAIAEAVDLAAEISTDDSPRFVNGVLGRIAQVKVMLPEGNERQVDAVEASASGDDSDREELSVPADGPVSGTSAIEPAADQA